MTKLIIDEDDLVTLQNIKLLKSNNFEQAFSEKYRDTLDLKDDIKVFLVADDGYIKITIIFEDTYGVHWAEEEVESHYYLFGEQTEKEVLDGLEKYVVQLIKAVQ